MTDDAIVALTRAFERNGIRRRGRPPDMDLNRVRRLLQTLEEALDRSDLLPHRRGE